MTNSAITTAPNHVNNFDFLRLAFATAVIYTHSYSLTSNIEKDTVDIMGRFSHGQVQLSGIAVTGFFVLSGYLIMISLLRSHSLLDYFFKRSIRVFPALWLVVIVCMIGGYFVSGKTAFVYFTHPSFYRYALNGVLHMEYNSIDGIFEQNAFKQVINGSLWTVPYEFLFYILLAGLFFLRNNLRILRIIAPVVLIAMLIAQALWHGWIYLPFLNMPFSLILTFAIFFGGGATLALFKLPSVRFRTFFSIAGIVAMLAFLRLGGYQQMQFLLLPPLVIYFGTLSYHSLSWVRRFGDLSYGIYIWSFPIQQVLCYFLHPTQTQLVLLSIPLIYAVAYAS